MFRINMIISAMANSTTELVLLNGALNTAIPFFVAVFKIDLIGTDTKSADNH